MLEKRECDTEAGRKVEILQRILTEHRTGLAHRGAIEYLYTRRRSTVTLLADVGQEKGSVQQRELSAKERFSEIHRWELKIRRDAKGRSIT